MARARPAVLRGALPVAFLLLGGGLAAAASARNGHDPRNSALVDQAYVDAYVARCSVDHPGVRASMQAQRAAWLEAHSDVLAAANAMTAALPPDRRTALATVLSSVPAAANRRIDDANRGGYGSRFCTNAIAKLDRPGVGDADTDATNYDEAAFRYFFVRRMTEAWLPVCSSRFPQHAPEFAASADRWRERDAVVYRNADAVVRQLEIDPQRMADFGKEQHDFALAWLDRHKGMREADGVAHCRKLLGSLADGEDRRRMPRTYQFLENGPSAD